MASKNKHMKRFEVKLWAECRGHISDTPFQFWQINMRVPKRLAKEGRLGIPSERLILAIIDAETGFEIEKQMAIYFPDFTEIHLDKVAPDYIPPFCDTGNEYSSSFENRTKLYKVEVNGYPVYCDDKSKVKTSEVVSSINNYWHGWNASVNDDGSVVLKYKEPDQQVTITSKDGKKIN